MVWIVVDFLRPRTSAATSGSNILVAGPIERFEPSTVTAFQEGKIYLSRLEDGGFLALSRSCTHLGCTVPWNDDENRFVCPCHASAYDEKGEVLNPPAPRPLDFYPVRIENGIVKVDLSTPLKRRSFNATQVTHA
jgi:cytochrome b6-f complex iron-sulfur subunit